MIPISKEEAKFLRQCKAGRYLSHPTRHKKYFMAEEPPALHLLEMYRKNKTM